MFTFAGLCSLMSNSNTCLWLSCFCSMPHNTLVEGAVLFEEFCKEIACLVFAKRTVTLIHSAE